MRYFCVKTSEYLQAVLEIVSRKATHYFVMDVPTGRAQSVVDKLAIRYHTDVTPRQRTALLNVRKNPVFDIVVLNNQEMAKAGTVRLCVLVTLPQEVEIQNVSEYVYKFLGVNDRSFFEKFEDVEDRKNRLCFKASTDAKQRIYELVQLPYTSEQIQQKKISKTLAWTWRLHRDFIKMKEKSIEMMFKNAQKSADKKLKIKELDVLWSMSGYRGVREDIFKMNHKLFALSFKYLNRPLGFELKVPNYVGKQARLTKSYNDMVEFHQKV